MKIEFVPDDGRGRSALIAKTQTDDGSLAVDCLLMDAAPIEIDYDRIAVAACLIFGDGSNSIEFDWPVSLRLAEAIASSGPRVTSEIELGDGAEVSIQATHLQVELGFQVHSKTPSTDCARLSLVPGERFQGSLHGVKESIIGSNAWLLAEYVASAKVLAGIGALYSRDFLASTVEVSADEKFSADEETIIRRLYRAVNLSFAFSGGHS